MDEDTVVVVLEVWIGIIGVLLLLLSLWMLVRWCSNRLKPGYMAVRHTMDDEERRFQRSLESGSQDEIDELFRFDEEEGDVEFDQSELQQLQMLESYREDLTNVDGERGGDEAQRDAPGDQPRA